eukprot:CAMPEP_0168521882 /NCGR_PEP_ID=MMETSP0405-20121227/8943_1 /TAXON_ID=498012 /ORGANISM="Trichosphaerium sp, Strain Am-I-7 wt" /LENGTH=154 /DNA_ID=CAMNT_0008543231 /DNA_START=500 /DNA_END=964 /DNA_ORIENTATION=-
MKAFRRIYDSKVRKEVNLKVMTTLIRTLHVIVKNALEHPDEPKYLRIPGGEGKKFHQNVITRKGGLEFVIALGIRKRTENGAVFWVIDPSKPNNLHALQEGLSLLSEKKGILEDRVKAATVAPQKKKIQDKIRAEVALARFQEDREDRARFDSK